VAAMFAKPGNPIVRGGSAKHRKVDGLSNVVEFLACSMRDAFFRGCFRFDIQYLDQEPPQHFVLPENVLRCFLPGGGYLPRLLSRSCIPSFSISCF
jgi:hypothetical protein